MKRALFLLLPAIVLTGALGCEETILQSLPADLQGLVSSLDGVKIEFMSPNNGTGGTGGFGDQIRDRLMDGSCDGDGNQYGGSGDPGQGAGNGSGDQLRLRDGSCDEP